MIEKKERSTRRKQQGEATKKKISDTALRLFNEYGVENVSVDDIVKTVGIARGTFYVHFGSKNALISELLSSRSAAIDTDYEEFFKTLPEDMSAGDALFALVGKICDVIVDDIGFDTIRTIYKVQMEAPYAQTASGYERGVYRLVTEVLQKGISREEFRSDLTAEELSKHLVLAIRGLTYEWCIRYSDFDYKEQVLAHFKILLDGLKAKQ